ncbi:hypothetical protein [Ornithinimicrobium cavernae]|uniref:hypothetical protein n=1 Tax=Ornithinimicrobium cavernae TaxID=2666047 RepID=UPI0012B17FBB|nr:hypothetical protein [Ornithinimicrobium cavernae]
MAAQGVAVAALSALATFTIFAFLIPQMDPECSSNGTGSRVCPLPEARNPALIGILEVRWPPADGWEGLGITVAVLSVFAALGISIFLSMDDPWSSIGGAPHTVGLQAALAGTGLALVAAGIGYVRPIVALALAGAGLLALLLAALTYRRFVRTVRRRHVEHQRRRQLREHGTRVIADVLDVSWRPGAGTSEREIFEVTARPRGTTQVVTALPGVPRSDAPVIDGTVDVCADGEHDHPTGINVVMDADPDSVRDPDFEQRYPDLSRS